MRQNLIYDVGLHLGEDSEFYLKKGFDVVAVEANPVIAAKAANRLKAYVDAGRLIIVNKAITQDNGPITFFVSDVSAWGSTDPKWAKRWGSAVREITVPGIRFHRLLEEYGVPYYMKIDIEGADALCLEGLLASADRPKYVSMESSRNSFEDVVNEFWLLQKLGYRRYKIVAQHRINEQRLPSPAMEGQFIDHVFEEGSSGAFGRELPGEWISLDRALEVYTRIWRKYWIQREKEALKSRRAWPVATAAALARQMLPDKVLRGIKARIITGWYDTHAVLHE